jgi:hypothetical protein
MKRLSALVLMLVLGIAAVARQSTAPPKPAPDPATPPVQPAPITDFLRAADEVLSQMSTILHLPIKEPLKKSLRSKQDIRNYLIREEKEDKSEAQHYADQKSLEAFGLIPKGFPLDSFMLDVLTDQVAGLYDPKGKEFYIADWIPIDEQKEVMSHELTHALEDQSFTIDPWLKAARPNDDAELARNAVSEGTAIAAMIDYTVRDSNLSVRTLPDISMLIRSGAIANMNSDPILSKAPSVIRDSLLFPYLAGAGFAQQFLKAHAGWTDLKLVFQNPPVSTQQILHPEKYLAAEKPVTVTLPDWKGLVPDDWKLLDANVMGEFGLQEILKQYLGEDRASLLSPAWAGDRYAVFENAKKETPLVFRIALDNDDDAARFFGQYSEALELKYATRTQLFRRPNFFQFQSDDGGNFLRCVANMCLVLERASRETYDKLNTAVGWMPAPAPSVSDIPGSIAQLRTVRSDLHVSASKLALSY